MVPSGTGADFSPRIVSVQARALWWWDWVATAECESTPEKFVPIGWGAYDPSLVPGFVRGPATWSWRRPASLESLLRRIRQVWHKRVPRSGVFISYAHNDDNKWIDGLLTVAGGHGIEVWTDRDIEPGDDWHLSIQNAVDRAKVGVLLVSPKFLDSDYVKSDELPKMFRAADSEGLTIFGFRGCAPRAAHQCIGRIRRAHPLRKPWRNWPDATNQALNDIVGKLSLLLGVPLAPVAAHRSAVPTLMLIKGGGGVLGSAGAVRRVALALRESSWDGALEVRSMEIEALETELGQLESLLACSPEQGARMENLRGWLELGRVTIRRVTTALKSTFWSAPSGGRSWGVRMTLDDATEFIENLFVHAGLTARRENHWVNCWLYLPAFKAYGLWVRVSVPETDLTRALDEWRAELSVAPRLTSQWADVLPILAFHDATIARCLLPAIVFKHATRVPPEEGRSVAEFWSQLTELSPSEGDRDPLNPFDWCVAAVPDISVDDLKWEL